MHFYYYFYYYNMTYCNIIEMYSMVFWRDCRKFNNLLKRLLKFSLGKRKINFWTESV